MAGVGEENSLPEKNPNIKEKDPHQGKGKQLGRQSSGHDSTGKPSHAGQGGQKKGKQKNKAEKQQQKHKAASKDKDEKAQQKSEHKKDQGEKTCPESATSNGKPKQDEGAAGAAGAAGNAEGQPKDQPQKSKAELKAERRAKQEAQRAAKVARTDGGKPRADSTAHRHVQVAPSLQVDDAKVQKKVAKKLAKEQVPVRPISQKKVGLFSHLHQYEKNVSLTQELSLGTVGNIHPSIIKLGVQYAKGIICGSNARCIALLLTLNKFIADYNTPAQKELSRDLETKLKPNISFLTQCRPLSVSMGNAIKFVKYNITRIPPDRPEDEAKKELIGSINRFIHERIFLADEAISNTFAKSKIHDGDVILTYSCSSLVVKVLKDAHDAGKKFTVIVVDSRPKLEGRECLRRLVDHGIRCSYVHITAMSYVIKEVSKVFLGAHALLANGYVKSRVGTSMIALMANAYNIPVLVCCETYKFSDRVQTDSFVSNELGDPDDLVSLPKQHQQDILGGWRDITTLHVLNLVYDVTPPNFISMVITEVGMIPCTSVPVVLRVQNPEM